MILQALYEYAQRKQLVDAPETESGKISFVIVFGSDGCFCHVQDLREAGRGRALRTPKAAGNTAAVTGRYIAWLAETAERTVAGFGDPAAEEKNARKQQRLLELTRQAAQETQDALLALAVRFLERLYSEDALAQRVREELTRLECRPIDRVTLGAAENYGTPLFDTDAARSFWRDFYAREMAGDLAKRSREGQCLITGQRVPIAITHNEIRLPAVGQPPVFASFDKDAFTSYGWEKGANCPVGRDAMVGYTRAFEDLANHRSTSLSLCKGSVRFIFWTREGLPERYASLFDEEAEDIADPQSVRRLLTEPWRSGEGLPIADTEKFHMLCYSINMKRLLLRGYSQHSVAQVKANLARWREKLTITLPPFLDQRRFIKAEGRARAEPVVVAEKGGPSRPPTLWELQTSLYRDADDMPDRLVPVFVDCAHNGTPLPVTLLPKALDRLFKAKGLARLEPVRMALIRAILNDHSKRTQKGDRVMEPGLDECNTEIPYRLGRLLAVFESVQYAKNNPKGASEREGLNVTLTDRYFAAACTSPAAVFPTLEKLVMKLLSQLRRQEERGGLAYYFTSQIEEIKNVRGFCFPRALSSYDQGRFVVGYYHERARRHSKENAPENTPAEASTQN